MGARPQTIWLAGGAKPAGHGKLFSLVSGGSTRAQPAVRSAAPQADLLLLDIARPVELLRREERSLFFNSSSGVTRASCSCLVRGR